MLIKLAIESLKDRKESIILALIGMTISIFVLLGVEHIRQQTKKSFVNALSGTDLIIGARTSNINLLLYSVFRLGSPTNNISWNSFKKISSEKAIEWAIPISLGDSHKSFPVIGTNINYFKYFKYGAGRTLSLLKGTVFDKPFDIVIGHQVARKLKYKLGDNIYLSHGLSGTSFSLHKNYPFRIVGILAPTGTPVDRTLHISLKGIELIHRNDQTLDLKTIKDPDEITAIFVGLKSKITTFQVQRQINEIKSEPLLAILPGVALSELWQISELLENSLLAISALVFIASCIGVSATVLSSIRERTHELILMRTLGAHPMFIFNLIAVEAMLITSLSIILSVSIMMFVTSTFQEFISISAGINIPPYTVDNNTMLYSLLLIGATAVVAVIPSYRAYCASKFC